MLPVGVSELELGLHQFWLGSEVGTVRLELGKLGHLKLILNS